MALSLNLIFLSCGGNNSGIKSTPYVDPGDGDFSQYTQYLKDGFGTGTGLAYCNRFQISKQGMPYMVGLVAHPEDDVGDPNEDKLIIKVTTLDPTFFRESDSVGIEFFKIHGGNKDVFHDPNAVPAFVWSEIPNLSRKITPSLLNQLQIQKTPFFIVLEDLGADWNEIGVSISGISSSALTSYFLLPSFLADPNEYAKDTDHSSQMVQMHPFISAKDQKRDFVEDSKKYCF